MRSGGNDFNYFPKNKLTTLANLVEFKCMLMFFLPPLVYGTAFSLHNGMILQLTYHIRACEF